jgi:hypothetical protein
MLVTRFKVRCVIWSRITVPLQEQSAPCVVHPPLPLPLATRTCDHPSATSTPLPRSTAANAAEHSEHSQRSNATTSKPFGTMDNLAKAGRINRKFRICHPATAKNKAAILITTYSKAWPDFRPAAALVFLTWYCTQPSAPPTTSTRSRGTRAAPSRATQRRGNPPPPPPSHDPHRNFAVVLLGK